MSKLRESAVEVLEQFRDLILAITRQSQPVYAESGVGCHLRHVVDHFRAFELGVQNGVIDYNQRSRLSPMEKDSETALRELEKLISGLHCVNVADLPVTIISEICCSQRINTRVDGTTTRELLFLIQHSIHHLAYAALLSRQYGIDHDPAAGIAPATATYRRGPGVTAAVERDNG